MAQDKFLGSPKGSCSSSHRQRYPELVGNKWKNTKFTWCKPDKAPPVGVEGASDIHAKSSSSKPHKIFPWNEACDTELYELEALGRDGLRLANATMVLNDHKRQEIHSLIQQMISGNQATLQCPKTFATTWLQQALVNGDISSKHFVCCSSYEKITTEYVDTPLGNSLLGNYAEPISPPQL